MLLLRTNEEEQFSDPQLLIHKHMTILLSLKYGFCNLCFEKFEESL